MKTTHGAIAVSIIACLSLLNAGCSRKTKTVSQYKPSWRSHIITGTDFLMVINMAELRDLDWYSRKKTEPDPVQQQLSSAAGFSQDNVSMILVTSDIDAMPPLEDFRALGEAAQSTPPDPVSLQSLSVTGINVHVFLTLDQAISWDQMKKAANIVFADSPDLTLKEYAEQRRLLIKQKTSAVPLWISLMENGQTIHLSTSDASPEAGSDNAERSLLALEEERVHSKGPIRIAVSFSKQMTARMKESIKATKDGADDDTMAVALGSIAESFQSFKCFGLSILPSEAGVTVHGSFELGGEEEAIHAEGLIQSTLIPLIMMAIPQEDENAPPLLQDTKTKVQGARIILDTIIAAQSVDLQKLTSKEEKEQ